MLRSVEIRRQVAQRLRELLPKAKGGEESADARIGSQTADLLVKFRLGEQEHTLVIEVSSLGQPRQIRAAVTRLGEVRRELAGAHPVAAAVYIGPKSARILKGNNLGFIDLSGNCYLAFDNVLIEKEGKRNVRPSTRPLRSLFAPRATRVARVLLAEPGRAWRLEELAKAAEVSLGHAYNVVKRLEEVAWVGRGGRGGPSATPTTWSSASRRSRGSSATTASGSGSPSRRTCSRAGASRTRGGGGGGGGPPPP